MNEQTFSERLGAAYLQLEATMCPHCAARVNEETWDEPALFDGSARQTRRVWCARCGWSVSVTVSEIRP